MTLGKRFWPNDQMTKWPRCGFQVSSSGGSVLNSKNLFHCVEKLSHCVENLFHYVISLIEKSCREDVLDGSGNWRKKDVLSLHQKWKATTKNVLLRRRCTAYGNIGFQSQSVLWNSVTTRLLSAYRPNERPLSTLLHSYTPTLLLSYTPTLLHSLDTFHCAECVILSAWRVWQTFCRCRVVGIRTIQNKKTT